MPRASRSRKRLGNDGGGFPLGMILGLATGTGGEANPAFGATGEAAAAAGTSPEGMVDFNYKGDPSTAIRKFGTDKPFKSSTFLEKMYGMDEGDELNRKYRLGKIESEDALRNLPREIEARESAQSAAMMDRANREDLKLASDLLSYAQQEQARTGKLTAILSPQEFKFRYGTQGASMGLPAAEVLARKAEGMLPRAMEAGTAQQGADISKSNLASLAADQETGVRQKYPGRLEASLLGEFDRPALEAEAARNQLPWTKFKPFGDALLTDPNDLSSMLTFTPATKGGETVPDPNAPGGFRTTVSQPPMPVRMIGGDVIRPKRNALEGTKFAPEPTKAPANVQKPAESPRPLVPSMGSTVNSIPSLEFPYETETSKSARKALERQAAEEALEALKARIRAMNMAY